MESIDFFHGTRVQPPLVIPFYDGKAELECTISEGWGQLIVHSLKCGAKYVRKLKRSIGMVYTERNDLESLVSGSLGMKGIASLDAQISSKIGTELQLNRSEEIEDEFTFESPKCGERVIALYQFRRNIHLKYRDNRMFHKKEWSMSTTYWADRIHDNSYMISKIPECGCEDDTPAPDDDRIYIDMGTVTMTTGFIDVGSRLKIPALDLEVDKSSLQKPVQLSRNKVPGYLVFLSGNFPEMVAAKISLKDSSSTDFENYSVDETAEQQIDAWKSEWDKKHGKILNESNTELERTRQEEARAYAKAVLLNAIAEGLEKASDEKNLQEIKNNFKILQEQLFSKGAK
jgi:hypothetical protein